MSKSYSHEVRLLQKAVECARGSSGGKQQFKLTETADLAERLSRAVLQRDEYFREKIRLGTKVGTCSLPLADELRSGLMGVYIRTWVCRIFI